LAIGDKESQFLFPNKGPADSIAVENEAETCLEYAFLIGKHTAASTIQSGSYLSPESTQV
jgi:hypothetical protein